MGVLQWIEKLSFCTWLRESPSVWADPMFLFMHTLGMSMIAGGSAVMDLGLLGFWPKAPIKPLERLYPLLWTGFCINLVTGTSLLLADATSKGINPDFWIKMIFVFSGVGVLLKMRKKIFGDPNLDKGPLPASAKRLAWISLICWLGAITCGRLLAYLGPVSGLGGITNH